MFYKTLLIIGISIIIYLIYNYMVAQTIRNMSIESQYKFSEFGWERYYDKDTNVICYVFETGVSCLKM